MTCIDNGGPNGKPVSLEKFREAWLRRLILHRGIKGSMLRVAIVLGYHINRKTGLAFPGMRTIRRLTSLSTSTISAAVNWLEVHGYLKIERGKTRNATNRYVPLTGQERSGKTEHPVRPVRTPVFAPGDTDLPTYLPKEPPSYNAAVGTAADRPVSEEGREKDIQGRGEILPSSNSSPTSSPAESPRSKAYRLASMYEGNLGRSRVAKAEKYCGDINEIVSEVEAAIEDGDDLGFRLAGFWIDEWRSQ